MLIDDLLDMHAVTAEIEAGYVTERAHPEFPELRILNYTDRCQFDRRWNDVTRTCRGVIYNADTRELIARGMPKWFNHGDTEYAPQVDPDERVNAYTKWDGSLGIVYTRPDGVKAIATRGSFASEQAIHANNTHGATLQVKDSIRDATHVYEIIYAANRIVVDYGNTDRLVHLGIVHHDTGKFIPDPTNQIPVTTIRGILTTPFTGDEGFIVETSTGQILKWKHDEYLALHRIVSNLTVKEVWRQLRAGTFNEFVEALPDEFHQWAMDAAAPIVGAHEWTMEAARTAHLRVNLGGFDTRKDQALYITRHVEPELRGLVFSLLDDRDITDQVWRMVEPKGPTTPRGDD